MKRSNEFETNLLCNIVGRYVFHAEKSKSEISFVAEMARKICEVELWELWALTQE